MERPPEVVQILLAKGAAVDTQDNDGKTALMKAAENGHLEVVQALVAKGAAVDAKTKDGETALSLATKKGVDPKVIEALRAVGAR